VTKEYRLRLDPRLLELLGPNLYTNIYYVLAELIANAYDADAHNVYIISSKDEIRVEDDGHGMSYEGGEVAKYLNVAGVSRTNEADSLTEEGRRKMGRKGVGKLAALSVSADVDVLTIAGGEKSGFVLTRRPGADGELAAIPDEKVTFNYVKDHGSAIVMRQPQYRLHKTLSAAKRNLLKIFPLVNHSFRVHLVRGNEVEIIDDFDRSVMGELATFIALGSDFAHLAPLVPNPYPTRRNDLVSIWPSKVHPLTMRDQGGVEHEYELEIRGWIGAYASTRGRKAELTDFPDNFISLFANGKLGEFNILQVVGQNRLSEVYVVGQLHVDLFEATELPDMALSNRQGYKSDDPRYEAVLDYAREVLTETRRRRDIYADLKSSETKRRKEEEQRENEAKLRSSVDDFRRKASASAAEGLRGLAEGALDSEVREVVERSINEFSPDLGLKALVDSQKKKILISQTWSDKEFSDVVLAMLLFNNVPSEEILFTNSDEEVHRVPEGASVYEYLRDFFIESYSTQKPYVIFITSANTKASWGAITEVGATWITKFDHKIFNIRPFRPEHPLDDEVQWQSTNREATGELWMDKVNADIFCVKIESVCDALGYSKRTRSENVAHLQKLIQIR
jgi:hypothetical protein